MKRSKRFEVLEKRPVNLDGFSEEWAEVGLIAMESDYDPEPSIEVAEGVIVEMDGKKREDFDSIDLYIADYGINIENAREAMKLDTLEIARMLVDVNVPREKVIEITTAITPAKITKVMSHLNVVEIMMAQMKMRARRRPSNQAHVTNLDDNPVLMAADAAEAVLRGFSEIETTTAVSRYAPFNALALLVGGLCARKRVLSQCSLEESLELKMGMQGLTSYAETVSVYGTEAVMTDGDDTPWSKGFLASVYASRGIKTRFTSGTGAEVLMGNTEKKSMLYLEARCLYLTKACGVQGTQNGSVSCIGIPGAVPGGFRVIAAENLMASMLNLEVASGNDQTFTHSDMRRMSKVFMQLLPGTDFITSGFSAMPNFDDMFAGSNTDCDDYDDWYVLQRDMRVDGGLTPVREEDAIRVRHYGAKALQAVFQYFDLPEIREEEVKAAAYAYSSFDMPKRNMVEDLKAAEKFLAHYNGLDVAKALWEKGYHEVSENVLDMLKQRITGDYLHTSAIFDEDAGLESALNDPNLYEGPGTGYQISEERWGKLVQRENILGPKDF
ncbi:propanediol/glycerol family dehydratase large subunit [Sinanaerobacter chloroacetimidivorans]|uniref:Propanediol/glycerol family dehydratase large subunit n=1 Tax=Sinanaerobacter chloroacetimidivorans TaxID=2818044 RepID=A0A8J8B2A1_9FIRM|nr:propanediol/glycerol family dehydratase large subunit [Sinanaerobacter chloroacetimidivorans]MBR0599588.1 propanediol/glycerol family dehydratase large subunit [Sinanaerobacter chloroacetimidivorans]